MRKITKLALANHVATALASKESTSFRLSKPQRKEIVKKLLLSQKGLCAYCECRITEKEIHVEHFYEQHLFPTQIYDYQDNFILSCQGNTIPIKKEEADEAKKERVENISCGHKKAKQGHHEVEIDYDLLLNPMEEIAYLFQYNDDGTIEASIICKEQNQQDKVNYTIKRLNLEADRLKNARVNEIIRMNRELAELNEEEQKEFILSLLEEDQNELTPYYSTIKDNYSFLL
ncbi:MAG: retron system putative HNH endonuclease [Bacteroidia bacterium]